MSPLDPEVPPAARRSTFPGPPILPVLTALGITLLIVGRHDVSSSSASSAAC